MHRKSSFTLIELLVVIAIVGILAGIIIVSMSGATDSATIAKGKVFSNSMRDSMAQSIVSEWKFDGSTADGGVATANDILDTWGTNNGTSTYAPTVKTGSNCVIGSCLQFDGTNDYVDFGNNSSLSMGTGDATISLWVKFDNQVASEFETLIKCGAGGSGLGLDGYWMARYSGTSKLYGFFSDGLVSRASGDLSGANSLIANTWYNIVIVFDRDSSIQAYVNGTKQPYSISISAQQSDVTNNQNLSIGAWAYNNSRLAGKMDEVRIYNSIMPTSQIKQEYFTGLQSLLANKEIMQEEYQERLAELNNYCFVNK
jgi:prepilin-type N-terminal cleavage/methylation domain-containing protein